MVFERRKYTRYRAREDTYAALGSNYTKVGKIKDIGIGGLAFEYIYDLEEQEPNHYKVSIFLTSRKFFLWNFPCQLIYEVSENFIVENHISASFLDRRRCGLQFSKIQESQKQNLEYFCNHHTLGLALSSNHKKDHKQLPDTNSV